MVCTRSSSIGSDKSFDIHTLATEDVLLVPQRPKVYPYEDHNFMVLRMLMPKGDRLVDEQVGIFCFNDTLITFQERPGDLWPPILRERIEKAGSRLRHVMWPMRDLLDDLHRDEEAEIADASQTVSA